MNIASLIKYLQDCITTLLTGMSTVLTTISQNIAGIVNGTTTIEVNRNIAQSDTDISRNVETGTLDTSTWLQVMPSNVARVQWFLQNTTGADIIIASGEAGSEVAKYKLANNGTISNEAFEDIIKTYRISVQASTGTITLSSTLRILAHETSNI